MKHTAGPWNIVGRPEHLDYEAINSRLTGVVIAMIPRDDYREPTPYHRGLEEVRANTALIAATPDLLEAAQGALARLQQIRYKMPHVWGEITMDIHIATAYRALEAAIAKATKEG